MDELQRFLSRVQQRGPDDCWPWTGRTRRGYGIFNGSRAGLPRNARATHTTHRYAYERLAGPIPDGMVLDHICHNRDESCPAGVTCRHRRCCNPAHLEPVPLAVNVRRGRSANGRKTHCAAGHEFTAATTYWRRRGGRSCRRCQAAAQQRHRQRKTAPASWQPAAVPEGAAARS